MFLVVVLLPAVTSLLRAAAEQGSSGQVLVPGVARTLDPYWAALVIGTAAHLDDFDDTHLATVIHPGACALATVVSLAPETGPSGAAFLAAFAVGCEAQLRIGNAISPAHYDHGWHITGTCGVFGAAVAASALLGLDADGAGRALALAGTMTAGHREAFGSMTKPLHAGKAAANGILAARLAATGLAGPPGPPGPRRRARRAVNRGRPHHPGRPLGTRAQHVQDVSVRRRGTPGDGRGDHRVGAGRHRRGNRDYPALQPARPRAHGPGATGRRSPVSVQRPARRRGRAVSRPAAWPSSATRRRRRPRSPGCAA